MNRIPKTIHWCWFGNGKPGPLERRCMESWRLHFPGYSIKCWNEDNFDIHCCQYVEEAYKARKWAFVSDYVRFSVLYKYGGLYFDTDVEVIRPLNDLVEVGPFMGFEVDPIPKRQSGSINPGLGLATFPGLEIYREMLESYENSRFRIGDHMDQTTVVKRITDILTMAGLKQTHGIQSIAGLNLYPSDYFNPLNSDDGISYVTDNTRTIHHFNGSWLSPESQFAKKVRGELPNWLPLGIRSSISRLYAVNRYRGGRNIPLFLIDRARGIKDDRERIDI